MNNKLKNKARLTGILYLLVILLAGFSQGYVRGTIVIPDDPQVTLTNIISSEVLFRLGLISDLLAFMIDAVISILLYQLLKSVNKTIAAIASVFRLLAHPAIGSLNLMDNAIYECTQCGISFGRSILWYSLFAIGNIALSFCTFPESVWHINGFSCWGLYAWDFW